MAKEEKPVGIPNGLYCYTFLGLEKAEKENILPYIVKKEFCPFFNKNNEMNGICSLMHKDINGLIKKCGINETKE